MTLRYTSHQAIANRLEKRSQVGGPSVAFGSSVISPALIDQVLPQVEAVIDLHLGRCYQVPLRLAVEETRQILAMLAELGGLAQILPVQIVAETGKEGGLRAIMAAEFEAGLKAICPGGLTLRGEILLTEGGGEGFTTTGKRKDLHPPHGYRRHYGAIEGEHRWQYGWQTWREDANHIRW